ncbi:hypothetical protein MMC22_003151 [Lobaria immixta]|nr:hypothetical protein [Lobaria immixta]
MSVTLVLFILQLFASTFASPSFLNLTAISATNGESTLECWQLSDQFTMSSQAGTAGTAIKQLGNVTNATYTILPAKFDGGAHRAPAVQYVAFLSGLAHVTLPNSTHEAWIHGGKRGLILVADTAAVSVKGHITVYPSDQETVALQIPTAGGQVPSHRVLYEGACRDCDLQL